MLGIKTRLTRLGRRLWREVLSSDPRDRLVPPPELVYVGLGDFKEIGERHLGYFVDLCRLEPGHRVLDVGCGVGRIAIPLTQFLDASGGYEGFDVVAEAVDWCRGKITPRYPGFRFRHVDVRNGAYNATAAESAATLRFPYGDGEFDFVCAVSVFTHLVFDDARNYLAEIGRVLKPGAASFVSFYVYDEEAARLVAEGRSSLPFLWQEGRARIVDPAEPEHATAYEPDTLREMYAEAGLEIVEPIRQGGWCERRASVDYQDVVVARKP